jgi:predicted alpha/beta hydrolase
MSYRRSYRQRIAVHYSGSVSYPASQHGGSTSYSGTAYEDVTVNIEVDTRPFDSSINSCNNSVNMLTGAVVATEAAQITSISSNAKKVAGTIIEGFFKNIRFEISAQIAELTQKINSHLMHLREMAKSLAAKKEQMSVDYHRTSNRYVKIFDDLNNELSNRIYELNKPAFVFKQESDNHATRTSGNDLVNTVAVFGLESGALQAKISASITKKRALDTINRANVFLLKQKKLESTIDRSMLAENISATKYFPVCFIETCNEKSQIDKLVYQPDYLPKAPANGMIDAFQTKQWSRISTERKEKIQRYFNAELNSNAATADPHADRVKNTIMKIFDMGAIQSV